MSPLMLTCASNWASNDRVFVHPMACGHAQSLRARWTEDRACDEYT